MLTRAMRIPAAPRITLTDAVLAAWAAFWIALGVLIALNTRQVAELGGTVSDTGTAVTQVGGALGAVSVLPGQAGTVAQSVQRAGADAQTSGRNAQAAADRLAIYLAIAVGVIPSMPLLGLYLPIRLSRMREARAARRSLAESGDDPRFQEFLARRAVQHLPYAAIMAVSEHPWDDLREGRFSALAQAELDRLDVRPLPPRHGIAGGVGGHPAA
jgi:hypothetical protein